MPSYAFNCSGSPPVDDRSRLRSQCNLPIILLILCECSPPRLPCLVVYRKATQQFPRPYPWFTSYLYKVYEIIPPLVTTWYTIWAKVIVIVATYHRVVTLLLSSLGLSSDRQRPLLVPRFGLSISLWSWGLDEYLSCYCCNACIAVSSNISNGSQEFTSCLYPSQATIYCTKWCGNFHSGFLYHLLSTILATT